MSFIRHLKMLCTSEELFAKDREALVLLLLKKIKKEFSDGYFPKDVRNHEEIEFLELMLCNMYVANYVAKFKELSRYCPHYNGIDAEGSKCMKLKNGMCHEIKQFIGYQDILRFSVLVNNCIIYDKDSRARSTHYKSVNEKEFGNQNRGKPYTIQSDKGNKKSTAGSE